jgi:hypothetical protein
MKCSGARNFATGIVFEVAFNRLFYKKIAGNRQKTCDVLDNVLRVKFENTIF